MLNIYYCMSLASSVYIVAISVDFSTCVMNMKFVYVKMSCEPNQFFLLHFWLALLSFVHAFSYESIPTYIGMWVYKSVP